MKQISAPQKTHRLIKTDLLSSNTPTIGGFQGTDLFWRLCAAVCGIPNALTVTVRGIPPYFSEQSKVTCGVYPVKGSNVWFWKPVSTGP